LLEEGATKRCLSSWFQSSSVVSYEQEKLETNGSKSTAGLEPDVEGLKIDKSDAKRHESDAETFKSDSEELKRVCDSIAEELCESAARGITLQNLDINCPRIGIFETVDDC